MALAGGVRYIMKIEKLIIPVTFGYKDTLFIDIEATQNETTKIKTFRESFICKLAFVIVIV